MDEDLERMSRAELLDEVRKLRRGERRHRDSSAHELCWHHPQLRASDPLPSCRSGPNSCAAACAIGSPWTSRHPLLPERASHSRGERSGCARAKRRAAR